MHVRNRNLFENMRLLFSSHICQNKAAIIMPILFFYSGKYCWREYIHTVYHYIFYGLPDFWQSIHIPDHIHSLCYKLFHVKIEFFAINNRKPVSFWYTYPPYYFCYFISYPPVIFHNQCGLSTCSRIGWMLAKSLFNLFLSSCDLKSPLFDGSILNLSLRYISLISHSFYVDCVYIFGATYFSCSF